MSKTRNLANSTPQFSRDALIVPTGNTAQRPSVTAGYIRFNTDLGTLESANGVTWANVGSGGASTSAANLTSLTGNVYISAAGGIVDSSNAVGALIIPTGTLAQRPMNVANGAIRWNTTNTQLEIYVGGSNWVVIASSFYTVTYLVVAGGGGGGNDQGGGGGGGGYIFGTTSLAPGTSYTITVGGGGTAPNGTGSSSIGLGYTAGGGGGGPSTFGSGGSSGSGTTVYAGGAGNDPYGGGGGGGGGGIGSARSPSGAGNGGTGVSYLNVNVTGGGGGGNYGTLTAGNGATTYGGGNGGRSSNGTAGTNNTGGGGGGGAWNSAVYNGAAGGSGIVIISYQSNTQKGLGGTVTSSAGYIYHTYTSSGTFTA